MRIFARVKKHHEKNSYYFLILIGSIVLGAFSACRKSPVAPGTAASPVYNTMSDEPEDYEGPTILGEQLTNPYTIDRMEAARLALDMEGIRSDRPFTVRATHLYVKFNPKTAEELEELGKDDALVLYDCPMDYEKIKQGNWYREPGLADDMPTPQYAAVKKDYVFKPGISYEILDVLYIPEEDVQLTGTNLSENQFYMESLLTKVYTMAGVDHLSPYRQDPIKDGEIISVPRRPNGRIEVFDTRLNRIIGMEGVRVTANRWFTTHEGITDVNGDYYLDGTFKRRADYNIWFERPGFTIARNRLQRAKISRNNISGNAFSFTIMDGRDRMHGHMFRAAFRYFFKDNGGLRRPNVPNGWKTVIISNDSWEGSSGVNYIITPHIKVRRYVMPGFEYQSDEIFSTTVHEIAHTAHGLAMNAAGQYLSVNSIIQESWAVGVEWLITGIEYREKGVPTYGDRTYNPSPAPQYPNQFAFQYWNPTTSDNYTSLFVNLVDDFNEKGIFFPGNGWGTINDPVRGFNLNTIESAMLKHTYGISSLSTQLKANKPAGVTDAQIDLLLSHY